MKFKDLRIWILIFGGMLLIGAYLYQHSKTNQKQLESQGIKAIFLAKQNFVDAFYNYHIQLEGYFKRNFYTWAGEEAENAASRMVEMIDRTPRFGIKSIKGFEAGPSFDQSVLDQQGISLRKKDSLYLIEVNGFRFSLNDTTKSGKLPELNQSELVQKVRENLGITLGSPPGTGRAFEVDHVVPIHTLMENNIQSMFFDRLFVLDSSGTAIYPRDMAGLPFIPADTLGGLHSVGERKLDLQLSGTDFQGFLSPALIGNKGFYLLGIKEKSQFERVALRIDFRLLSTFLTLLILIFVSIPIISIFNLGNGDILTKKRVLGLGLSLILVMLILGFFSFSLVQNYRSISPGDQYVHDLKAAFSRQIDRLTFSVDRFSNDLKQGKLKSSTERNSLNPDNNVNEFLEFDPDGNILTMLIPGTNSMDGPIDFGDFPFVSIANRDYVKELPVDTSKHFISAHFSKSTGNLEGVISKRAVGSGFALTFRLDSLAPKISKNQRFFVFKPDGKVLLKSQKVNIPINYLQEGIGEEKWDEIKTLIANNQHADEKQVWKTPIYVNGHEYEALLSRISSGEFVSENWVLYLENQNLQHALHSLSSLEASTVFVPYLMVLVLLALLMLLTSKSSIYLAYNPFSFEWYSPSSAKRNRFLWLNGVLFLDLLLFVAVYMFLPLGIFKIYLWSALFAIQSGTCNFLLLSTTEKDRQLKNSTAFLVISVSLWLVAAYGLIHLSWMQADAIYTFLTLFFLVVLGLLQVLCWYLSKVNNLPSLSPDSWTQHTGLQRMHKRLSDFWNKLTGVQVDKRVFALNFLLWLMIIGFLPGYFIHRQIFNQEKFIWDNLERKDLVEKEYIDDLSEFYVGLIEIHEEFRRTYFGRFSNHEDELIRNFVAPPYEVMIAAFNLPPNFDLANIFSGKNGGEIIKRNLPILLALAVVLIWLFHMIMRLGNKIYLIDYHFTHGMPSLPTKAKKQRKTFVIGVDAAQSRHWISSQFGITAPEMLLVNAETDLANMPELESSHRAVVFENIHCLEGVEGLLKAMLAFGKYDFDKPVYLFVTSGKPLQEIILQDTSKQKRLLITEIFSEYLFQYVPLDFENRSITLPYSGVYWELLETEEREAFKRKMGSKLFNDQKTQELAAEIASSPHSEVIANLITEELSADELDECLSKERYEKCILSIQRYNKAYFMNIWAELSLKERKMVYNYATEGFINFFNKETMTALIQKGIIRMNADRDRLVLFSNSFRNFVCIFASEQDVARFKQDERKSGNAKMIQAAVFSFVLISVALISFYDPTILNETSAYISGVLGLVGTLYSLLAKGFAKAPVAESQ